MKIDTVRLLKAVGLVLAGVAVFVAISLFVAYVTWALPVLMVAVLLAMVGVCVAVVYGELPQKSEGN